GEESVHCSAGGGHLPVKSFFRGPGLDCWLVHAYEWTGRLASTPWVDLWQLGQGGRGQTLLSADQSPQHGAFRHAAPSARSVACCRPTTLSGHRAWEKGVVVCALFSMGLRPRPPLTFRS